MTAWKISFWSVCLCSRSWELQLYANKHKAKCSLLIVRQLLFCSLLFNQNSKYFVLKPKIWDYSSAEAGIVLNLLLNFEQKCLDWTRVFVWRYEKNFSFSKQKSGLWSVRCVDQTDLLDVYTTASWCYRFRGIGLKL